MKFPILKGKQTAFPRTALCPQCKRRKVFEPHSMAILSGGALLMDRKQKSGTMDNRLDGFLDLHWHGAHDKGLGKDREIYASVPLADECVGGQFEIYFCSTKCLRTFLNSWVDALEAKIEKKRPHLKLSEKKK